MSYEHVARGFEAGELSPAAFRHVDHIGVAFEMLRQHDFLEATYRYARGIQALASAAGAPDKFNTTITLAFMSLIGERMHAAPEPPSDFASFIAANPDLLDKDLLDRWYSSGRLASELSRRMFLMPDVPGRRAERRPIRDPMTNLRDEVLDIASAAEAYEVVPLGCGTAAT